MRREKLLGKLADVLCRQPRASMEQLACDVGIGRTTLHRYFPSRGTMLEALSEQAVTAAAAALADADVEQGPAQQALRRLIEAFFPIAELYAFISNGSSEDAVARQRWEPHHRQLLEQVRRWQQLGELRMDVSAAWILESLVSLVRSAGAMVHDGRLARSDAVDSVCAVLFDGLNKR